MLTILALPFLFIGFLKKNQRLIIPAGVTLAIVIELFALGAGRWAYNELMPIVPLIEVGLTPTIQLGLIGYIVLMLGIKEKDRS